MQGLPPFRQRCQRRGFADHYTFRRVPTSPSRTAISSVRDGRLFRDVGIGLLEGRTFNAVTRGSPRVSRHEASRNDSSEAENHRQASEHVLWPRHHEVHARRRRKGREAAGLEAPAGTERYVFYDQLSVRRLRTGAMNVVIRSTRPLAALTTRHPAGRAWMDGDDDRSVRTMEMPSVRR